MKKSCAKNFRLWIEHKYSSCKFKLTIFILSSKAGSFCAAFFKKRVPLVPLISTVYNRTAELDETTVEYLAKTGGFSQIGRYTFLGAQVDYTYISGGIKSVFSDDDSGGHTSEYFNSAACDEVALPLLYSGGSDSDIYKTTRTHILVTSALAIAISTALFIIVYYAAISKLNIDLNIMADQYRLSPERIAELREQIKLTGLIIVIIYLTSIPMHLLSCLAAVLGTIPPTTRALRESITEGIRKDTD